MRERVNASDEIPCHSSLTQAAKWTAAMPDAAHLSSCFADAIPPRPPSHHEYHQHCSHHELSSLIGCLVNK